MSGIPGHELWRGSSWHGICECGTEVFGVLGDELSLLRRHRDHLRAVVRTAAAGRHPAGQR